MRESADSSVRLSHVLQFAALAPTWSALETPARLSKVVIRRSADGGLDFVAASTADHTLYVDTGAALHHVRLALDAFGERFTVEEFPSAEIPAHVALEGRTQPSAVSLRLLGAATRRRTLTAPFSNVIVPAAAARALANECKRERVTFRVLVGDERDELARLVAQAEAVCGVRSASAAPLAMGAPLVCVVSTPNDAPRDWLAAGQALSALTVRATELGLYSAVLRPLIDVHVLRTRLAKLTRVELVPQLLLCLGPPGPESDTPSSSAPETPPH